jgi:dipeptidyl aminopeptidase/acylaminoacyl peptidase
MSGLVAPFAITRNGTLVYRSGVEPEYRLLMRDPRGTIDTLRVAPKITSYARFSPDGRSLALTFGAARGTNRHTAIYDLALGTLTRFTLEGGGHSPVWSPDGTRLAFTAEAEGSDAEDIFVQPVDRSTKPVRIIRMPNDQHGWSWPAESVFVFSSNAIPKGLRGAGFTGGSIAITDPRAQDATPRMFLESQEGVNNPIVSPDGHYVSFTSNENGTSEIYVRPFPSGAGGQWRISTKGGQHARWSGDGRTIYYLGTDLETIHAVHVNPGPPFTVASSEVVATLPGLGEAWDVDRRSGRMVLTQAVGTAGARIVVLMNWLDEFRRTAAAPR